MDDPLDGTVTRNRLVAHRVIDGQAVIVLPKSGDVLVLNDTGSLVWELLDGTRDIDAIAGELAERFTVDRETAQRDVELLCRELVDSGAAQVTTG